MPILEDAAPPSPPRRSPRFAIAIPVRLEGSVPGAPLELTFDLSQGGLGIQLGTERADAQQGTRLDVTLVFDQEGVLELELRCQVAWRQGRRCGLQILETPPETATAFKNLNFCLGYGRP